LSSDNSRVQPTVAVLFVTFGLQKANRTITR